MYCRLPVNTGETELHHAGDGHPTDVVRGSTVTQVGESASDLTGSDDTERR